MRPPALEVPRFLHHPVASPLLLLDMVQGPSGPFIRPLTSTVNPLACAGQRQNSSRLSDHKKATQQTFVLSGARGPNGGR